MGFEPYYAAQRGPKVRRVTTLRPTQHRATSQARLRARDHCTSSTLIGGKGGAGPSSLHTWLTQCLLFGPVHTRSQVTWAQSVQSQPLRTWKVGHTTSHGFPSLKSQAWHECLHGNTFWRWGLSAMSKVGQSKHQTQLSTQVLRMFA